MNGIGKLSCDIRINIKKANIIEATLEKVLWTSIILPHFLQVISVLKPANIFSKNEIDFLLQYGQLFIIECLWDFD